VRGVGASSASEHLEVDAIEIAAAFGAPAIQLVPRDREQVRRER
jgi:hypothetical protein